MSATDAVLQNAAYHAQLLASISELDYVPSALKQQDSLIASLQGEAAGLTRQIKALESKTSKERKEHEALRDSTTRRFAAKLTGRKEKFEAKASKEEREYVEALEKEMQHKRQLATIETMIAEAQAVRFDLNEKFKRYEQTKKDLAQLYSRVFDGPTQAYPEDDNLEYQLGQAQQRYNEIQGFLNRESQAVNLLQSAHAALQQCSIKMQEARDYSQWDMWGGGAMSDMMERNALSAAEGHSMQAATCVQQAMIASPQVRPIGDIQIAHGSIMSDVLFDNIFTDMAFHDKIKKSAQNVEAVMFNLKNELQAGRARAGAIGADLSAAADALTRARGALDTFRRNVFDSLSSGSRSGSGSGGDLPAYTAGSPGPAMPRGPEDGGKGGYVMSSPPPPMMPQGPQQGGSGYAPPAGPPPPPGTYAPPAHPPPTSSYTPPTHPPPGVHSPAASPPPAFGMPSGPMPTQGNYAPPALGVPATGGSRAASPSNWGNRNPYAAALATGGSPVVPVGALSTGGKVVAVSEP
ncbi:hypothetical protein DFH06DRAFT_705926 [Mycena polygramma]|nr:hypothetical protein DFH06DRAFT_705926 [Mycena polygramma]